MLPRLATFCSRMISIGPASVLIGVGQQREEARALDRDRELALVERLRASDAARDDLAGLGDIALQGAEILVIDVRDAFRGEAAELLAAREAAATAAAAAATVTTITTVTAITAIVATAVAATREAGCSAIHD